MKRLPTSALAVGLVSALLWQSSADAAPVAQIQINGQSGNRGDVISPNTVKSVNLPPVCCIGPNCIHTGLVMLEKCEGLTTTFDLDASLSYDPEGLPLTFTWTACQGAIIADPSSPVTTITLDTSVTCMGDPGAADPVRIVMTHNTQPSRVYFDGIVTFGQTFVELGSAGHKNGKVPPTTRVQIFDLAGNLLQQSDFHTSCSQPLEVGDQFGAVIITGFTP